MPSGSREAAAISSILPIMRFDLQSLFPQFDIRGERTASDWRFEFTPKDPAGAGALGTITVSGTGDDVRHLEFRRSDRRRIEIDVKDSRAGVIFTAGELRQFFR